MRILHVITDLRFGGAETALARLAKDTAARGHHVSVVALKQLGPVARRLEKADIPCVALGAPDVPGPRTAWSVLSLAALLKRDRPDVVHAWLASGCAAVKLAAPPSVPRVMGLRVTDVPGPATRALLRASDGARTRWLAVSDGVRDSWAPALRVAPGDIAVVANGVDVASSIEPEPSGARPLFLGRLAHQKGVDVLLRALVDAPLSVDIAGAGPDEDALRSLAAELGVDGRARFTGYTAAPRATLSRASMLVLPSRSEGMPNAVLEAMAVGRAVVATDIPGTREVVVDGETGLLVPPGDVLALRAAVTRLQADADLRTRMGEAGRARAAAGFGHARVVEETLALYGALTGR